MAESRDTRSRILEVALDLFVSEGYDKVSLREIAQQVGVTKAALYYHFASKEEILRTLVEPLMEIGDSFFNRLGRHPTRESLAGAMDELVTWVLPRRKLMRLTETSGAAIQALADKMYDRQPEFAFQQRFRAIFHDETIPLDDRLRMAGAIGLAFFAIPQFGDVPAEELEESIEMAVADLLKVEAIVRPEGQRP